MNLDYLLQYISHHLRTILLRFPYGNGETQVICNRPELLRELAPDDSDSAALLKHNIPFSDRECPFSPPRIYAGPNGAAWAYVCAADALFCIGPVRLPGTISYRFTLSESPVSQSCLVLLYPWEICDLLADALLLQNVCGSVPVSLEEALDFNCIAPETEVSIQTSFSRSLFYNQENESFHNPYDQEIREVASIRNGDLEQLEKSWAEDYAGTVGTLGPTPLRHARNLGIILVTLGCRAAMEAGVLPEMAYTLSDSYIQKIEEVQNPEAAWQLGRQAEYQYASMVRDQHSNQGTEQKRVDPDARIEECKRYILQRLHGKISTAEIASALYLNPDYLSALFKKHEGITISEYILREKIQCVKNMLIYSRCSASAIAAYFGFSSQSYLGKQFKRVTGMTLRQYRETYRVKEF